MRAKRNRTLSIAIQASLVFLPLTLAGCMSPAEAGKQALQLETVMHQQMARGDFDGIYNGADERYQKATDRGKSDALFSAIARKLGSPLDCRPSGTFIQAATWGMTIKSVCTTKFAKNASGIETFVWIKDGSQYRLAGYHITSDELIER